jgi:2-keto-3-deoxy-L-rhamnonate aldolase RhmA
MGSHFKERLYDPTSRLLGMFVKFPTMETIEILASSGYDFVIIDMEHAPLGADMVYRMIVTSERSGCAGINRHVAGDARALQERSERLHPDPESCGRHREVTPEA